MISLNGNSCGACGVAPGTCCTSDERVKRNITHIDPNDALESVLRLKPVRYRFKEAYLKADHWVKDHLYTGFSAQDTRDIVQHAVSTVNRTIDGIGHFADFHHLHKEELVPIAIGAIHALHYTQQRALQAIDGLYSHIGKLQHELQVHRAQLNAQMLDYEHRMRVMYQHVMGQNELQ